MPHFHFVQQQIALRKGNCWPIIARGKYDGQDGRWTEEMNFNQQLVGASLCYLGQVLAGCEVKCYQLQHGQGSYHVSDSIKLCLTLVYMFFHVNKWFCFIIMWRFCLTKFNSLKKQKSHLEYWTGHRQISQDQVLHDAHTLSHTDELLQHITDELCYQKSGWPTTATKRCREINLEK